MIFIFNSPLTFATNLNGINFFNNAGPILFGASANILAQSGGTINASITRAQPLFGVINAPVHLVGWPVVMATPGVSYRIGVRVNR